MKKMSLFVTIVAFVILIGGCALASDRDKEIDNIFTYTIDFLEGKFSHTYLEFFQTKEEALETVKTKREAVLVEDKHLGNYIESEFKLAGLSNNVIEKCGVEKANTGDEILFSVSYYMTVTKEEKETFCTTLYEQAKEHMPETLSESPNSFEVIKTCPEQMNIIWKDEDESYVYLSVPSTPDVDGDIIILQITCPRDKMQSYTP